MVKKKTDGPDFKDWDWEDFERWKQKIDALNPDKDKGPDSKKPPIYKFKRRR